MLQNKAYSLRNKDALHEVRLCLETNAHLSNEIMCLNICTLWKFQRTICCGFRSICWYGEIMFLCIKKWMFVNVLWNRQPYLVRDRAEAYRKAFITGRGRLYVIVPLACRSAMLRPTFTTCNVVAFFRY